MVRLLGKDPSSPCRLLLYITTNNGLQSSTVLEKHITAETLLLLLTKTLQRRKNNSLLLQHCFCLLSEFQEMKTAYLHVPHPFMFLFGDRSGTLKASRPIRKILFKLELCLFVCKPFLRSPTMKNYMSTCTPEHLQISDYC